MYWYSILLSNVASAFGFVLFILFLMSYFFGFLNGLSCVVCLRPMRSHVAPKTELVGNQVYHMEVDTLIHGFQD